MTNAIYPINFLISMPGGSEWILIAVVLLLLFGGKKIPELMRSIGKGMREFKDARESVSTEFEKGMNTASQQEVTTPKSALPL